MYRERVLLLIHRFWFFSLFLCQINCPLYAQTANLTQDFKNESSSSSLRRRSFLHSFDVLENLQKQEIPRGRIIPKQKGKQKNMFTFTNMVKQALKKGEESYYYNMTVFFLFCCCSVRIWTNTKTDLQTWIWKTRTKHTRKWKLMPPENKKSS